MVRFKDGKPIALHLSAHADGHSFPWSIVEKMGDRPVGYVAKGSHAMYAKPGSKHYSPVPVVGPVDYTNKGILWDPSLNYVATKFDVPTATFTPLTAPPPTATTTAAPPTPGEAPAAASHPGAGSASPASTPVYDTKLTPEEIVTVLDYKGRWGNSFSDVREPKGSVGDKVSELGDKLHNVFHFGKKHDAEPKKERRLSLGLSQRLSMLRWAEGPTGPRYKSLERVGVTWNTTELSNELV
ncbi:Vacuolar protein sorting-associated protein 62 [Tulasnella sp. 408]|nr:Vacuolar protein sorting-associated protein 62 [Tulasnella sp. 408]